jgi:hypothetical protein
MVQSFVGNKSNGRFVMRVEWSIVSPTIFVFPSSRRLLVKFIERLSTFVFAFMLSAAVSLSLPANA